MRGLLQTGLRPEPPASACGDPFAPRRSRRGAPCAASFRRGCAPNPRRPLAGTPSPRAAPAEARRARPPSDGAAPRTPGVRLRDPFAPRRSRRGAPCAASFRRGCAPNPRRPLAGTPSPRAAPAEARRSRRGAPCAPCGVYAGSGPKWRDNPVAQACSASASGTSMTGAPSTAMRHLAPPVRPIARAGTPAAAARASRSPARLSASDTMTREAVSPNSVPASATSRRPVERLRRQGRFDADAALEAAFGQRDRNAAFRAVVRRLEQPVGRRLREQPLQRALEVHIQSRRPAPHQTVHGLQILAAAELGAAPVPAARPRTRRCGTPAPVCAPRPRSRPRPPGRASGARPRRRSRCTGSRCRR